MSLLTSAERDQVQSEVQVVHVSFGDGAGEELDMRLFPSWDLLYKSPVRVLRVEMRKHAEVSLFAPRHERKVLI